MLFRCSLGAFGALVVATSALGQGVVQSRLSASVIQNPFPGTFSVDVLLEARVVGDPGALNLGAAEFAFDDDDALTSAGAFAPSILTAAEAGSGSDGPDMLGRAGMFPIYRPTFSENDDPANGQTVDGRWTVTPITLAALDDEFVRNPWSSLYKVRWTTSDLSARQVEISAIGSLAGYRVLPDGDLVHPVSAQDSSVVINIPAPGGAALLAVGFGGLARRRR